MTTRNVKFTTTTTGQENKKPVAVLAVYNISALMGSIIQLDGRGSYDPEKQPITWKWRFVQVPIGSTVADSGFRDIRPLGTAVSFIPDRVGIYVVELIVNDGEFDSDPVTVTANIQMTRVPIGESLVPDGQFLWSYISNFWNLVEDREVIATIWSSVIQSIGSDLITLWGTDRNKSLATIQNTFQRRWQAFETSTSLLAAGDQRIVVGKTDSGTAGYTGKLGEEPGVGNTQVFYTSRGTYHGITDTDFTKLQGNYGARGRIISVNDEGYTIQRASNEDLVIASGADMETVAGGGHLISSRSNFTSDEEVGKWVLLKNGPYAGYYLIQSVVSSTELVVTHTSGAAVSFATSAVNLIFDIVVPYTVIVADQEAIPDGQAGVRWRIPHLLHTPTLNLEDAGVRKGDVVIFEVTRGDIGLTAELRAQVVCVDRTRLGFEFSLGDYPYDASEIMDRSIISKLLTDLKVVPPDSDVGVINGAIEAFIAFMPISINLVTRPFTTYRFTFKAKKVLHNTVVPYDAALVSVPALQEQIKEPPVVLRENLDYIVEDGGITFVNGLFTLTDPAPERLWAECVVLDNSGVIEKNFGRLVGLSKNSLTASQTRAPYLSAVKGLVYAFTNGPTVGNIRLGLQILMGLPFTEERGLVLDIQESFTKDARGSSLGRILIEDIDEGGKRLGFRRFYFYPMSVGLETNPFTGAIYKIGDTIEQFSPLSKGVEVTDYIKDPYWWVRALVGAEILKYFVFKVLVDSSVFDSNDLVFALEFLKAIKPTYTKVITTTILHFSDDISSEDVFGGAVTMSFYDNPTGLEACNKASDDNQEGFVLNVFDSPPFETRTLHMLRDVRTYYDDDSSSVRASSVTGWDFRSLRARSLSGFPVVEGDMLVILRDQKGSFTTAPGIYEIGSVVDSHTLELLQESTLATLKNLDGFATFQITPLDPDLFEYGEGLICVIVRRGSNPVIRGNDLETNSSDSVVTSALSQFMSDAVSVGDHFVIEPPSVNSGEYLVDALSPLPLPPTFSETQLLLKNPDGTIPALTALTGQGFRVVRRDSQPTIVKGAQSVYESGTMMLQVLDSNGGPTSFMDVFTPGMVGLYVEVSDSENPLNDGRQIITSYVNCGKVGLALSSSVTSDAAAQAIIHFK